jgi:hypothetical protein
MRQIAGGLLKAAILGACVYGVVKWQYAETQDGDVAEFAQKACIDEIGARYNVTNAKPYDVRETGNGYVVRVSVTSARGTPAKVTCLTNSHGGLRDITIEER